MFFICFFFSFLHFIWLNSFPFPFPNCADQRKAKVKKKRFCEIIQGKGGWQGGRGKALSSQTIFYWQTEIHCKNPETVYAKAGYLVELVVFFASLSVRNFWLLFDERFWKLIGSLWYSCWCSCRLVVVLLISLLLLCSNSQ